MAYSVPPLPYAYDALEPHIDKATMEFHHDKHHQAYVTAVNAALEGTPLADTPIEDVLRDLSQVPADKLTAVKNNGGGHYNHTMFWENMSPDGGGEPSGALGEAIGSTFGSFADFQAKIKETGVKQFGSGWSWLIHDGSGLAIVGSANQDNPISDGKTPLLGVDVWEHAYYLKYQNRRPTTSTRGGTSSTGRRSPSASRAAELSDGSRRAALRRGAPQLRLKRRPATGERPRPARSRARRLEHRLEHRVGRVVVLGRGRLERRDPLGRHLPWRPRSRPATRAPRRRRVSSRWTVLPAA